MECVPEGLKCQRDAQCCDTYVCDKASPLTIDGTCGVPRNSGSCYRDGQCVNDCKKKWYKVYGQCE